MKVILVLSTLPLTRDRIRSNRLIGCCSCFHLGCGMLLLGAEEGLQ